MGTVCLTAVSILALLVSGVLSLPLEENGENNAAETFDTPLENPENNQPHHVEKRSGGSSGSYERGFGRLSYFGGGRFDNGGFGRARRANINLRIFNKQRLSGPRIRLSQRQRRRNSISSNNLSPYYDNYPYYGNYDTGYGDYNPYGKY